MRTEKKRTFSPSKSKVENLKEQSEKVTEEQILETYKELTAKGRKLDIHNEYDRKMIISIIELRQESSAHLNRLLNKGNAEKQDY